QRTLDRIGRDARPEQRLDRVGKGLEEVAIVPRTDVEGRRQRAPLPFELASEVPARRARAHFQHQRLEAIAILDEYPMRGRSPQFARFDERPDGWLSRPEFRGERAVRQ